MATAAARTLVARFAADTSGLTRGIAGVEKEGRTLGSRLASGLKKTAVAGVAVAGAAIGTALTKGIGRLTAIEDAEAKLSGLGHSAQTVAGIMDNALAAVKGTAFGMDEAASAAASAVAAGIKPGKELQRVLSLMGDAATIAGTDFNEMGSIFNKVAASNRVSMEEIQQLQERGLPILQLLADQYGVNAEAVRDMVTRGEVDFAAFAKAIEDNIGGAALKSGETTRGALANVGAAVSRFGATLASGFFPALKDGFATAIDVIDGLNDRIAPFADQWGKTLAQAAASGFENLINGAAAAREAVTGFFDSATGQNLKTTTLERLESIWTALRTIWRDVAPAIGGIIASLSRAAGAVGISTWSVLLAVLDNLATIAQQVLVPALNGLSGWMTRNQGVVTAAVAAFTAWKLAVAGFNVATMVAGLVKSAAAWGTATAAKLADLTVTTRLRLMYAGDFLRSIGAQALAAGRSATTWAADTAAKVANRVATVAVTGAQKAMAVAQGLVNAAMRANPIIAIVSLLIALGAALVTAYKRSETFRNIVQGAWRGIQTVASAVWGFLKRSVIDPLVAAFNRVGTVAGTLRRLAVGAFQGMQQGIGAAFSWIKTRAIDPLVNAFGTISGKASSIAGKVGQIFGGMRDAIGRVFGTIVNVITAPIRAVFGWINRNLISKINAVLGLFNVSIKPIKFARGGYVPGRGNGDTVPALLTPGEGVLNKRTTRALGGRRGIEALNRRQFGAFGGVLDWFGERWEDLKGIGRAVKDQITGWLKQGVAFAFEKIMNPVLGAIVDLVPASARFPRMFLDGAMKYGTTKMKEWGRKKDSQYDDPGFAAPGDSSGTPNLRGWAKPIGRGYRVGMRWMGYPGHTGQDLPAATGTPVYAAAAGKVIKAAALTTSYGKHFFLQHAGNIRTVYAHLSSMVAKLGQTVRAGQLIGRVGSTGNSTGPHLHFETRAPSATNPIPFMSKRGIKFDSGGWLPPGRTLAINNTGRPEPILTRDQLSALTSRDAGQVQVRVFIGDRELTDIVRTEVKTADRATGRRLYAMGVHA